MWCLTRQCKSLLSLDDVHVMTMESMVGPYHDMYSNITRHVNGRTTVCL
jgi:hypothetical protein